MKAFALALFCAALLPHSQAQNAAKVSAPSSVQTATPAPIQPTDPRQDAASLASQVPAAKPEDVKSPEAIVAACYDVISGPAGGRNWDRFRSLFLPVARLTASSTRPDGKHVVTVLGVGDYVQLAGRGFSKDGFYENAIRSKVNSYGNMAQVFSSYESRHAPGAAPFQRGVNSFQMLYDGQRWWIVSILWDDERKDNPLPADMAK